MKAPNMTGVLSALCAEKLVARTTNKYDQQTLHSKVQIKILAVYKADFSIISLLPGQKKNNLIEAVSNCVRVSVLFITTPRSRLQHFQMNSSSFRNILPRILHKRYKKNIEPLMAFHVPQTRGGGRKGFGHV